MNPIRWLGRTAERILFGPPLPVLVPPPLPEVVEIESEVQPIVRRGNVVRPEIIFGETYAGIASPRPALKPRGQRVVGDSVRTEFDVVGRITAARQPVILLPEDGKPYTIRWKPLHGGQMQNMTAGLPMTEPEIDDLLTNPLYADPSTIASLKRIQSESDDD